MSLPDSLLSNKTWCRGERSDGRCSVEGPRSMNEKPGWRSGPRRARLPILVLSRRRYFFFLAAAFLTGFFAAFFFAGMMIVTSNHVVGAGLGKHGATCRPAPLPDTRLGASELSRSRERALRSLYRASGCTNASAKSRKSKKSLRPLPHRPSGAWRLNLRVSVGAFAPSRLPLLTEKRDGEVVRRYGAAGKNAVA